MIKKISFDSPILSCKFSKNEKMIVLSIEKKIIIIDILTGKLLKQWSTFNNYDNV